MARTLWLTKSRFRLALECPTKLYYTGKEEYQNTKIDDQFLKALAKGGFQVGELAKHYYPGGTEVLEKEHEAAIVKTNELLRNDGILYEAAIRYEKLFIRTDILIKRGKLLKLIEVKAKSFDPLDKDESFYSGRTKDIRKGWKPYLYDVAFQKYVLQKAFPEYTITSHLLLVDKSKQATVDGLNQKFLLQSGKGKLPVKVTGDVTPMGLGEKVLIEVSVDQFIDPVLTEPKFRDRPQHSFEEWINIFSTSYLQDTVLWDVPGSKCDKCEFVDHTLTKKSGYHECWTALAKLKAEDFNKPSVLTLYDSRRKDEYIAAKKYFLESLVRADLESATPAKAKPVPGLSRIDRQELQINKAKAGDQTPYIDVSGLRVAMREWKYPLHLIDFETTAVALPFNKGRRPYEQIVFQFSHHTLQRDGTVAHEGEWLNNKTGAFPNFEFIRTLKKELENTEGSIFRYAAHENSVLNAVYRQLKASAEPDRDELGDWIKTITKSTDKSVEKWQGERNMIDLLELVGSYYYHPNMQGSYSIKSVLPAMLQNSKFLKEFYGKPTYGDAIKSRNFRNQQWIVEKDGKILDPYELLPPLFEGFNAALLDSLILAEDTELNDGGAAMIAYAQMQFTQMSDAERERVRQALFQYCELDTLAMVMIIQDWIHQTQ